MSNKLMSLVWDNTELEPIPRLILLRLADNADERGLCWPSVEWAAKKCNVSARTVQRYMRLFESLGYLRIEYNVGRENPNRYWLVPSAIASPAPFQEADSPCRKGDTDDEEPYVGNANGITEIPFQGKKVTLVQEKVTGTARKGDTCVTRIPIEPPKNHQGDNLLSGLTSDVPIESPYDLPGESLLLLPAPIVPGDIVAQASPEAVTPEVVEIAPKKKYKFTPEDVKLATWIAEKVAKVVPSARLPATPDAWANEIRMMREIDRHSLHEIATLFDWANRHHFWWQNILSVGKLRQQWTRLQAQREADYANQRSGIDPNRNIREQRAIAKPDAEFAHLLQTRLEQTGYRKG